ncbi:MAG: DNA polymerase III subunit beta, partial [Acetomicrobium sp.]|nr:DNA polymerase III subunit beta [Acetomicrobium sp.]
MRIKINDQKLIRSWQITERTSRGPKTSAILSGIYVKAYNNDVILMATDLKTSIKCLIHDVTIEEEGESIFPTKGVGEILKKLSHGFTIEATNAKVTIKHEKNQFNFTTYPTEEFPKLPSSESAKLACRIKSKDLSRLIKEGSFTGSTNEEFPQYLSSALIEFKRNSLKLIATDGKRLSLSEADLMQGSTEEDNILIPIRGINELERILSTLDEDSLIEILYDDSQCYFRGDDIELSIRRVESLFPPYDRIISSDRTTWMTIDRQALIDALEKVEVIVRDFNKVIIMDLKPAGNLSIS